eukprot:212567_1
MATMNATGFRCPERKVYDFIKTYLSNKKHIKSIEIGTLHRLMTTHVIQDIDGVDDVFPWRARGFSKFFDFVHSIPGLQFGRTPSNNHCVSIDLSITNIEPFFLELEKIPINIQSIQQRKQKRFARKRWRHKKQKRSFHKGYDVLQKLSFLSINGNTFDPNEAQHAIQLRDSFYSPMISPEGDVDYNLNPLKNINWSTVPDDLCPEKIILSSKNKEKRGVWKKRQIETFYEILKHLLIDAKDSQICVDFGCGSGNIGLALAYLFPQHEFVLIDYNPYCIKIAKQRMQNNGLKNVKLLQMKIEQFDDAFDVGIAVHCCGNATDYAQLKCGKNNAHFILCSCCVGKIKLNDKDKDEICYPRSDVFKQQISLDEFEELSRVADHNETDFNHKNINGEQRKLCKTVLELDRCFYALETKLYHTVLLTQIVPYKGNGGHSSTPKNDVIVGIVKQNARQIKAITKLFNNKSLTVR